MDTAPSGPGSSARLGGSMGLESITRKGAGTTRSIDNQSGAWRADADTRVSAREPGACFLRAGLSGRRGCPTLRWVMDPILELVAVSRRLPTAVFSGATAGW